MIRSREEVWRVRRLPRGIKKVYRRRGFNR
jgi:hypothetical protein